LVSVFSALQLFTLSAIWGASFLLIKFGVAEFPPTWVATLRLFFGAIFLWSVLLIGKRAFASRDRWGWLLLLGFVNNAIPFLFFAIAEQSVGSSLAAIINATTTIFSALIAVALRDSSFNPINALGVALGFAGVVLAVSGGFSVGAASLGGVALLLIASFCYALSGFIAKRKLPDVPPIAIATGQLSSALLILLPIAAFNAPAATPSPRAMLAVLALGILGSGVAYLIMYNVLTKISAVQLSSVTYLLPLWGLFWGAVDGEPITALSLIGVTVVLSSLYLINLKPRVRLGEARGT
jgi:drug/metabolite transporter (DMT)-like permease